MVAKAVTHALTATDGELSAKRTASGDGVDDRLSTLAVDAVVSYVRLTRVVTGVPIDLIVSWHTIDRDQVVISTVPV